MALEILEFALYCFIILFCVYPIVDRICKCVEQSTITKTFGKSVKVNEIFNAFNQKQKQ